MYLYIFESVYECWRIAVVEQHSLHGLVAVNEGITCGILAYLADYYNYFTLQNILPCLLLLIYPAVYLLKNIYVS